MLHRVLFVSLGLIHVETPEEDSQSRDDTQSQRTTPYSAEMVLAKSSSLNKYDAFTDRLDYRLTSREEPAARRPR
jgi:hypothetical protein